MIPFLLKLFGVKIDQASHVASVSLEWRQSGALGWSVLLGAALCALAWWVYRHTEQPLAPARRWLLTGLRCALFLLLLALLLRPVLSFAVEGSIRRKLLVLMDATASMKIQDPRIDAADIKRAAIGKGIIKSLDESLDSTHAAEVKQISRVELMRAVLENKTLDLLPRLRADYDVSLYGFGEGVTDVPATNPNLHIPEPKSTSTAIGDATRELLGRVRGQPIAGIVLITDGANNRGSAPLDAAALAGADSVPIYPYGVGITSPRDIIVGNLFTPDIAFVKDELTVTVRIRGQGLKDEKAKLTLKLGNEQVAEKEITFAGGEEQVVPVTFTPQKAGEFELQASVPAREDEAVKDNNSTAQRIKVIDEKLKVLLVEQSPRWEFRYLLEVLLRDRRVETKCVLVEGDPSFAGVPSSPYLAAFPATKEELFKFDLVILGDVDPKTFSSAQLSALSEFVSKFGGAALCIAGRRFMPRAYQNTALEAMLPVELDGPGTPEPAPSAERPSALELTAAGRTSAMLRLAGEEEANAAIWRAMPPVFWVSRVARAKPAAQVLMADPDPAKATRFGKMPVIASQQFGLGQTLYLGTDNTWRWRKNRNVDYHPLLWGQIIRHLALSHLLGGSKRTQLTVDKQNFTTGERVTIYARLYGESFEPVKEPTVSGFYTIRASGKEAGEKQELSLRATPEQPGMYRGEFVAVTPGTYSFAVARDPKTAVEFGVTEPKFELGETAMNEALLKGMAAASGGAFFREEDLKKLPETIANKTRGGVRTTVEAELWASPFSFLLLLAVATAEWILRRKGQLK